MLNAMKEDIWLTPDEATTYAESDSVLTPKKEAPPLTPSNTGKEWTNSEPDEYVIPPSSWREEVKVKERLRCEG